MNSKQQEMNEATHKAIKVQQVAVLALDLDEDQAKYKDLKKSDDKVILWTVPLTTWVDAEKYLLQRRLAVAIGYADIAKLPEYNDVDTDQLRKALIDVIGDVLRKQDPGEVGNLCMDDRSALYNAYRDLEMMLAHTAYRVGYKSCCKHCTASHLRNLTESLRRLNEFAELRLHIESDCDEMPKVLPDIDDLDNFEVRDGKFVPKKPKFEVIKHSLTKEQSEQIAKVLSKITKETVVPDKPEVTEARKCNCAPGQCRCHEEETVVKPTNFTFDYVKKLSKKVEDIQPKIIKLIESFCKKGDYDKITENEIFQNRLAKVTGIDKITATYIGPVLDPETNKEFPGFKIGLKR